MSKGRSGVLGEKQKRRTRQAATIIPVEKLDKNHSAVILAVRVRDLT